MCALAIDELETLDDLLALRSQWVELWRRCADSTPFQSPAWIIPWWKRFGSDQLRVVAYATGDASLVSRNHRCDQ